MKFELCFTEHADEQMDVLKIEHLGPIVFFGITGPEKKQSPFSKSALTPKLTLQELRE